MGLALKNVDRLDEDERKAIRSRAKKLRAEFGMGSISG